MVARVVVLPLPVGPVTTIKPCGSESSRRTIFSSAIDKPSFATSSKPRSRGNRRMTAESPCRAILRQAPFGDVEAGQNLDPGDQGLRQGIGRRGHGAKQTIDPHAHHEAVTERFDVNIAGPKLQGL